MTKSHLGPFIFLGISSLVALACVNCGGTPPAATAIAYVAHSQSHSMSIFKIPADQTVSIVQIGNSSVGSQGVQPSYPQNVVVSPDGSRAYVTDAVASVWVVDTKSNLVVDVVPAGTDPEKLAISADGKFVYVTTIVCGALPCAAAVDVIDTTTNAVTSTIPIGNGPGTALTGITITPDGTHVYVTTTVGAVVWAIDAVSNSVIGAIATTNSGVSDVAISPDGSRVYAVGWVTGAGISTIYIDVVDTQTNHMSAAIELGVQETPMRIAITPDGSQAFVIGDAGHMWVADTAQNALNSTITVSSGNLLTGIAFTPDGSHVYVSCGTTNTIYVLSTSGSAVLNTIPSAYPGGLAITRPL